MKKVLATAALIFGIMLLNTLAVLGGTVEQNFDMTVDGVLITYTGKLVDIEINDQPILTGDMPAIILDSRTLVPLREVFESESINAEVNWLAETKEIQITYDDQEILMSIGSNVATVNGESKEMDVPAKLIRDLRKDYAKTMIPLRFVAENLGYYVDWDPESYVAKLYSNDYTPKLPTALFNNPVIVAASEEALEPLGKNIIVHNIEPIDAETVEVTNLKFYYDESTPEKITFEVSMDNPISEIITSMEDNVMELYLLKATLDMSQTTFEYDDHPLIDSLSIIEYTGNKLGNQNCMVKFELNSEGRIYSVRTNATREKVYIDVVMNHFTEVSAGQDEEGDYIDLVGVATDDVKVYRPDSRSLSFDFDRINSTINTQHSNLKGQLMEGFYLSQKDAVTANLTVNMRNVAQYKMEMVSKDTTRIRFYPAQTNEIVYTYGQESCLILMGMEAVIESIDELVMIDNYEDKQWTVTIPGDCLEKFNAGHIEVNNIGIDDIDLSLTESGDTRLIINTNSIQGMAVEMTDGNLVFTFKTPGEMYEKVVVIDPGHGGDSPGAVHGGYYEKDINLDVALKLKQLLDADDTIKTYYTHLNDVKVSLAERSAIANEVEADLFFSIHANSYLPDRHGAITYYMDKENNGTISNKKLAQIIQDAYVDNTDFYDKNIRTEEFYMFRYTDMPAVLLEMGFMSHSGDLAMLTNELQQYKMAQGIYEGIIEALD